MIRVKGVAENTSIFLWSLGRGQVLKALRNSINRKLMMPAKQNMKHYNLSHANE